MVVKHHGPPRPLLGLGGIFPSEHHPHQQTPPTTTNLGQAPCSEVGLYSTRNRGAGW